MTHEIFKQIMTFSETYSTEQVNKFLDDSFECPVLLNLFDTWKTGNQRKVFDEIKKLNEMLVEIKKNDNSSNRIPKDANLPRTKDNKNSETKK